jgi:hypothetical protein
MEAVLDCGGLDGGKNASLAVVAASGIIPLNLGTAKLGEGQNGQGNRAEGGDLLGILSLKGRLKLGIDIVGMDGLCMP